MISSILENRDRDLGPRSVGINVSHTERVASIAGGAALVAAGLGLVARRSWGGGVLALLGGLLVYRGASGRCELYRQLGMSTVKESDHLGVPGNRGIRVEKSIVVDRAPTQVYHYWRRLENLPRFMPHVVSVEENHELSRWTVRGPAGVQVAWDAEIIIDRPGGMISWQSVPGSQIENAGSVWFEKPEDGRGTLVKVALQYQPPAGPLGNALARLLGESPERQLEKDLQQFKTLLESDSDAEE